MKRLIITLLIIFIGTNICLTGCVRERTDTMSKLTEAQIEKLYGRKKPFIPSGYRIRVQEELDAAIRKAQTGRFTTSQVEDTVRNIEREHPGMKIDVRIPAPNAMPSRRVSPHTGKPIAEMTLTELSREFDFRRLRRLLEQLESDQRGRVRQFSLSQYHRKTK